MALITSRSTAPLSVRSASLIPGSVEPEQDENPIIPFTNVQDLFQAIDYAAGDILTVTRGRPGGDGGEGDSSGGPYPERYGVGQWPTLVIEAGYSQSLAGLHADMRWWFSTSNHDVKIVILAKLDRRQHEIILERWEEEAAPARLGATTTRRAARAAGLQPVLRQRITISRNEATDPVSYDVSRGALVLSPSLSFPPTAYPALDPEEAIRCPRFWTLIKREEEPAFEEQRFGDDHPESVIASPTPQPGRRLMSRKRLTEQVLENETPRSRLEEILSKSEAATTTPASKKRTNIHINIAPKKAAATKTKQHSKDNEGRVTPPATQLDRIRMNQKADRLSKAAASSVAELRAYRIAAEHRKAAREAAAAAAAATANGSQDGETAAASGGPSQHAEQQGTQQQDLGKDAEDAGDDTEKGAEEYAEDTVATPQPHEVEEEVETECESIVSEEL
ncbi:hypothetical protein DL768_004890 [Monosporascus sp. mg162]|nr:hypothetical protein DL768_004890 [Monosporascus sp. mg162]